MDVGYFISELLGQHGEVNVPGLGYFAHTRVNGYYNDSEGKFYPPGYSIQFDPRSVDDDALAQHIADSKNISLASSKYFTEKFVANLKYLAVSGQAPLAEVGWFYTENAALAFRSNNNLSTGPEFFGLPPVALHKLGTGPKVPVNTQATAGPPQQVLEPNFDLLQFENDEEHEAYLVQHTKKRREKTVWAFAILAVLFTALIVYLYDKYDRSIFDLEKRPAIDNPGAAVKEKQPQNVIVVDSPETADGDTVNVAKGAAADSVVMKDSVAAASPDTAFLTGVHFEILGGAFSNTKDASTAIGNYKKLGFAARILKNVPGRKRKVTLGSYRTSAEAAAAQQKILNTGKIRPASIYVQRYNK